MITIKLMRNKKGDIVEYMVSGHANTDEYGKDIVCAAISILAQTMILGIHRILESEPDWSAENGHLKCSLPGTLDHEQRNQVNAILETMALGFENLRVQYPESIRIETKEVS